jgi:hypothetical protein
MIAEFIRKKIILKRLIFHEILLSTLTESEQVPGA